MSSNNSTPTLAPTLENLDALSNWLMPPPVRMDCFFVTLAVLLGTNVNTLSNYLGMPIPQPGSSGVFIPEIVQALVSLGLAFKVWEFHESESGGPIRGRVRNVREWRWSSIPGMPRTVGIGYLRPDRLKHVVICRQPGTVYSRYLDFQRSPRGADVARDVANSEICFVFWVDMEASHGQFFEQQRHRIEQA